MVFILAEWLILTVRRRVMELGLLATKFVDDHLCRLLERGNLAVIAPGSHMPDDYPPVILVSADLNGSGADLGFDHLYLNHFGRLVRLN